MTVHAQPFGILMADGVVLRGQRWGEGADWIILLHEPGEDRDLDDWRLLLPAIMAPERTLLTVDLRGHGASDGEADAALLRQDISTVLETGRMQGADWVALGGAGVSATEILELAEHTAIDALVLLSPTFDAGRSREVRGRGEPKLFAVGSQVESINQGVREARNRSIGWAMLVSMPTVDQGAKLLAGPYGSQLTERIVAFLAEQRMLARTRPLGSSGLRNRAGHSGEDEEPS